jgi:hypothetical protein
VTAESPFKQLERAGSEVISASLDYYRDVRDALSEAQFFLTFGLLQPGLRPAAAKQAMPARKAADDRLLPVAQEALATIEQGGYPEALARAACLLARRGEPFPLARIELKARLVKEYANLLPSLTSDQWHRIRGRQEIICRHEPEAALAALPKLLASAKERRDFLEVLDRLLSDPRIPADRVSPEQLDMARRIHEAVAPAARRRPRAAVRRSARRSA